MRRAPCLSIPNERRLVAEELTSWKEIAAYLKVTVRTAQLWESERGLPIRRLPGGRGRVLAIVAELEAWKNSGPAAMVQNGLREPENRRSVRALRGRSIAIFAVVSVLFLLGIGAGISHIVGRGKVPAQWRIERNVLVMLNDQGAELWRHKFERALIPECYSPASNDFGNLLSIVDVDGDGRQEVLLGERVSCTDCPGHSKIYCFSDAGAVKWTVDAGRGATTASGYRIADAFSITKLVVGSLGRRRQQAILVVAVHNSEEFSRVCLLSPAGVLQHEYWHAGHLGVGRNTAAIGDPDGDGVNLLYLSGVCNPRQAATFVVLDPDEMTGASQEDAPRSQLVGFPRGRERARIFFPRSLVNDGCGGPYNHGWQITLSAGLIGVEVVEDCGQGLASIHYSIRPSDFSVFQVGFADSYRVMHRRLHAEGLITSEFVESAEAERLLRSIGRSGTPATH